MKDLDLKDDLCTYVDFEKQIKSAICIELKNKSPKSYDYFLNHIHESTFSNRKDRDVVCFRYIELGIILKIRFDTLFDTKQYLIFLSDTLEKVRLLSSDEIEAKINILKL